LLAYKFAAEKNDKYYMQSCLLNPYKRGRINAFVAAEKAYGFARIIQWMKEGEGDHIDTKNLAGILVLPRPPAPKPRPVVAAVHRPVFDGIPVFPPPSTPTRF